MIVSDLKLDPFAPESDLIRLLSREGIRCGEGDYTVIRKSLDARDKSAIRYIYTVAMKEGFRAPGRLGRHCSCTEIKSYRPPENGDCTAEGRHVIAGAGPAGLFAGLLLAQKGCRPLIIERGSDVDKRSRDVARFWESGGAPDPDSNVCFGEGGAGTFSDGKLTTGVKDEAGREAFVLDTFVRMGADPSIASWYRPHIGTDVLRDVIRNLRHEIIRLGGEFAFDTKLSDIQEGRGPLRITLISDGREYSIDCASLILAVGHSARDTYEMLCSRGALMQPKAFAVGVRIEHPQDMIQLAQYGCVDYEHFPVADYRLTGKSSDGRGVYSFCMCPGGSVVNSSSEEGGVCVNGMSGSRRDGRNANSAIIISVSPRDFNGDGPLSGVGFQRELEKRAFAEGGGMIPLQLFGDFVSGRVSDAVENVIPDICGGWSFGRVDRIFEPELKKGLAEGIAAFGHRIRGFDRSDAVLTGVEGRTSSPVRILRDEHFESNIKGLFPCGEGAGYAGGITSAAMDGMRVAEEIIRRYRPC